ncbi:hypothetical protein CAS74_004956 [Pichia kudriavzevii]|uniref:HORMA domain-containing protein n=1 Tax=Pichia kudriavzevii TaxID=4909 RepID=A0A1Z8JI11_PICKU|nr:hypothetical protein CAS74_004956 [Pichia kudriavzevii]
MTTAAGSLQIKGSSRVISDYFEICIHNILFQRHIYPKEEFKVIRKFGLNLVFSKNEEVIKYISQVISQLHRWIFTGKISWLTLLIVSKESEKISEKWMFNIDIIDRGNEQRESSKPIADIQQEIQVIIRQISSSVAILPEFEEPQTFKILVHTVGDLKPPKDWDDAKPFEEIDSRDGEIENVKFNEFQTNNHNISTYVTYQHRNQ